MTEACWLARVALQHDYDVGLDWLHCLSNNKKIKKMHSFVPPIRVSVLDTLRER